MSFYKAIVDGEFCRSQGYTDALKDHTEAHEN